MTTKTPSKPVTVTLDRSMPKVTSVRYDAPESTPPAPVRTLYLANSAAEALGQPERITITITAG